MQFVAVSDLKYSGAAVDRGGRALSRQEFHRGTPQVPHTETGKCQEGQVDPRGGHSGARGSENLCKRMG